jgi:hypothetical protein
MHYTNYKDSIAIEDMAGAIACVHRRPEYHKTIHKVAINYHKTNRFAAFV